MGARPIAGVGRDRLNENIVGQLGTDPEARIANEADQVGVAADKLDLLLFAKADLAQAVEDLGRGIEAFDADGGAGDDAAERAKLGLAMAVFEANWHSSVHDERHYCN
jgi:hypothetical protein